MEVVCFPCIVQTKQGQLEFQILKTGRIFRTMLWKIAAYFMVNFYSSSFCMLLNDHVATVCMHGLSSVEPEMFLFLHEFLLDFLFSSPELKAQLRFSDRLLSVLSLSTCLSVCKLFLFFSRTTGPISTKLGTKHLLVKEIQVCSNEGPCPFQGEIITKQPKIH